MDGKVFKRSPVGKVNFTLNATSLAARLLIARHVDDATAADYRVHGNVEPLGLQDLDKFTSMSDMLENNRLGPFSCECRKMLPQIHETAKH